MFKDLEELIYTKIVYVHKLFSAYFKEFFWTIVEIAHNKSLYDKHLLNKCLIKMFAQISPKKCAYVAYLSLYIKENVSTTQREKEIDEREMMMMIVICDMM